MKINSILISILLLLTLAVNKGFSSEEKVKTTVAKETIIHAMNKSIGELKFEVTETIKLFREGEPTQFELKIIEKISIYDAKDKLLQTIDYDACTDCALTAFQDINFDGYDDLFIKTGSGSGGVWHDVWLFNPQKNIFEKLTENINNISINKKKKEVTQYIHDASTYEKDYYKVINNKLIMFKIENGYNSENGKWHIEIKVKSHGKWRTIIRKVEGG